MKLLLKNFCCWENKTFEFPENGIVLLTSPSGSGKTSILRAIVFALYGHGQKLVQHGKKNCSVELFYKGLHILRTKGPGRLVVNGSFEDQDAQEFINKSIRNSPLELIYNEQSGYDNFVFMNPQDKLLYLEKIAGSQSNLKTKLKGIIKQRETKVTSGQSEVATLTDLIQKLKISSPDPIDKPDIIVTDSDLQELDEKIKDQTKYQSQYTTLVDRIQYMEKELDSLKTSENKYSQELESYSTINNDNDNLETVETIETIKSKIQEILRYNEYCRIKSELDEQKHLYNSIIKTERDNLESKINTLTNEILKLQFEEIEDWKKQLDIYSTIIKSSEQYTKYKTELDSLDLSEDDNEILDVYKQEIETLERQLSDSTTTYTCPECDTLLQIVDKQLIALKEQKVIDKLSIINTLKETRNKYNSLQSLLNKKQVLLSKINDLRQHVVCDTDLESYVQMYKTTQNDYNTFVRLDTQLDDLHECLENIVEKYEELKHKIYKLEMKTKKLECEKPKDDLKILQEKLIKIESDLKTKNLLEGLLDETRQQLEKLKTNLENLYLQKEQVLKRLESHSNVDYTERLSEYSRNQSQWKGYNEYTKYTTMVDSYSTQHSEKEQELKQSEKELTTALHLKTKITEAETLAVSSVIDTVNTNVQFYLDKFFVADPLQVKIATVHGKKNQVCLELLYKGHDITLQSLSGGEQDRLVLAFQMTFAEICTAPLVLLDECVSSLDQENASNVFEVLQTHCKNMLIILVAHQIVTGAFDSIITL